MFEKLRSVSRGHRVLYLETSGSRPGAGTVASNDGSLIKVTALEEAKELGEAPC